MLTLNRMLPEPNFAVALLLPLVNTIHNAQHLPSQAGPGDRDLVIQFACMSMVVQELRITCL